jgi:hypothetical protein
MTLNSESTAFASADGASSSPRASIARASFNADAFRNTFPTPTVIDPRSAMTAFSTSPG